MALGDYDATPGNNADINGINIAEGCAPGNLNDAIRQLMADLAGGIQTGAQDATADRLLQVGAFGLGNAGASSVNLANLNNHTTPAGFYTVDGDTTGTRPSGSTTFAFLTVTRQAVTGLCQLWVNSTGSGMYFRTATSGTWSAWRAFWHGGNTTVDGNGFIKQASPIVRLYADRIEEPNKPVGAGMVHRGTGHYVIAATPPLATQGWQVQAPEGVEIDAPVWTDAGLHVRTYIGGRPADIPEGVFAMFRFWEGDGPDPDAPRVSEDQEAATALDNERARMAAYRLAWGRALRATPYNGGTLSDAVAALLPNVSADLREDYGNIIQFERTKPEVGRYLQNPDGINLSDEAIDDLFRLAMQIEAGA